jgi:hypothetical protein
MNILVVCEIENKIKEIFHLGLLSFLDTMQQMFCKALLRTTFIKIRDTLLICYFALGKNFQWTSVLYISGPLNGPNLFYYFCYICSERQTAKLVATSVPIEESDSFP